MSKPLTMTEQRKADIEHAIDHPSQADMDGEMHTFACNLWDEVDALRAALAAADGARNLEQIAHAETLTALDNAKLDLADECRHADAQNKTLHEFARGCVLKGHGNTPQFVVNMLAAHAVRRAAEAK